MNDRTTSTVTTTSRRTLLAGGVAAASLSARTPATAAEHEHSSVSPSKGRHSMSTITIKDGTQIYYKDWGSGQPVVFSHGWPLSGDDWDAQMMFFVTRGYRVIAHDRRGHGRSMQTSDGHDMDH